jgi:2-dehydropantoate 2-reductase
MRIAMFGSGGVGGNFGGLLAKSGVEVTFIARGDHLRAMRESGLRLGTEDGTFLVHPVQATDDPSEVGEVDVVLVAVKAWQVQDAARAMHPLVGKDTVVVPLLNGVEGPPELSAELGDRCVIGGWCGTISYIIGPGHVFAGGGSITIGELDNSESERTSLLVEILSGAGIEADIAPEIHGSMWGKFATIVAWSGVGAVTRTPTGVWRNVPESRRMYDQAVLETDAVARARGIEIPKAQLERVLSLPDHVPAESLASMQRDIMDGRPSELEYQNGAVARYGQEAGVDTPVNAFFYHSLLPLERIARGEIKS